MSRAKALPAKKSKKGYGDENAPPQVQSWTQSLSASQLAVGHWDRLWEMKLIMAILVKGN